MKTFEERAEEYGEIVKIRGWMPSELGESVYKEVVNEIILGLGIWFDALTPYEKTVLTSEDIKRTFLV